MPKNKRVSKPVKISAPSCGPTVPTRVLLKSRKFAKFQPDFVKALLTKESYTEAEATKIIYEYFGVKEDK